MTLTIVQLTDCHLFAEPSAELRGIGTRARFHAVLDAVAADVPECDLLVISGDTAHDESRETYAAVAEATAPWGQRLRLIPGNHDDRRWLAEVFGDLPWASVGGPRLGFRWEAEGWQVVGLDSLQVGEVAGALGGEQLDWLRGQLEEHPDRDTLLVVHHPPIAVHSPWIDALGLQDAGALVSLLDAFPQVRLLICGHVHQEARGKLGGADVLTTPAVGPAFRPRTQELVIDDRPAGYRVVRLEDEGRWTTAVRYVAAGPGAGTAGG